jgi:hypothetical protein
MSKTTNRNLIYLTLLLGFLVLTFRLILALDVSGLSGDTANISAPGSSPQRSGTVGGASWPLEVTDIHLCAHNPAKCPVYKDTWPGEPNAWQRTGRKWQKHSGTPGEIEIVWEWSAPYSGSNPEYANDRDNYYVDYSNTPDTYPIITGTAPVPFAWARWEVADDNYILHQFGNPQEELADTVGALDCESGLYYPMVSHDVEYSYTPMSVVRDGECVGGGYISVYRAELWGPPLSPTRVAKCDNPDTGIPADQSPRGNAVCKISPHVGVAHQRYVFGAGPTPSDGSVAGCEAVVYAWGWPKPQQVDSGQDYQTLFRNGELRFSRWLNLSSQVHGNIPAPDDHAWWTAQCEQAWSSMPNWLYTGNYRIGSVIYTDTITLPPVVTARIPISGGRLTSTLDSTTYIFSPDTFTDTVVVTHTVRFQSEFTSTGDLVGINRFYDLTAAYSETGQPAYPLRPYTVTIGYADADRGVAIEDSLALYSRDGDRWVKDPYSTVTTGTIVLSGTNVVFSDLNIVVANPDHFSLWAVLGETRRVFLPSVLR